MGMAAPTSEPKTYVYTHRRLMKPQNIKLGAVQEQGSNQITFRATVLENVVLTIGCSTSRHMRGHQVGSITVLIDLDLVGEI